MKTKIYSVLNLLSVIILIAWNGYANTGNFNGKNVGELSAEYGNLFTPASYAFSIWGLIFLMLLAFGVFGVVLAFAKAESNKQPDYRTDFVKTTAPWFLIANVFCTVWVAFWLEEMILTSVFCMLGILVSLLICVRKLDMEIWDAPIKTIAFVWWPLCLYTGWISVATIANLSAYLNSAFEIAMVTQFYVTIMMLVVAFIINAAMVYYRNMREYALVGVWALVAIFMRYKESTDSVDGMPFTTIGYVALTLAIILAIIIMIHGAMNAKTNPFLKLMQD
ncbi:MAG: hypothetical protein NWQ09_07170 [Nonlabens sp.]|nr:hypothetical protein [Nonlabens sp.]